EPLGALELDRRDLGVLEVVPLRDLLGGLVHRVVDLLEVDAGGDVEAGVFGHGLNYRWEAQVAGGRWQGVPHALARVERSPVQRADATVRHNNERVTIRSVVTRPATCHL